jgi:ankyrin repeat protein
MFKKLSFQKTIPLWLLLGLLLNPAQNWCSTLQGPTAPALLPLQTMDQSSEPIIKGYALKGMLKSIMDLNPGISIQEALLQSPLLAEMSRDWVLETYGKFTVAPDTTPGKEGRLITTFVDPETPLNQITRTLFNVTDGTLRPTEQPSNPFLGLNAQAIASMGKILHSEGIESLIKTLQTHCEVEQKFVKTKGKGRPQPASTSPTPTDDMVKQWYETYRANTKTGKLGDFGRFKKVIREQFIPPIKALDAQAITPEDKAKNIENLSKLFMTFLFLKDQREGATNPGYNIPTYFKALGSDNFTGEHYTRAELEELNKLFKGEPSKASLQGIEGIEATAFYLEEKIYGGVQALQSPYFPFKSTALTDPTNRFDGKEFTDCNESAIRSILNVATYDPVTGTLNPELLPPTMNPLLKTFLEDHNDPSASNYYQETTKDWLPLVSGIKGVHYLQDAPQGKFEVDGGPKNLLAILNHLLGTSADSFESLGEIWSSKNKDGRKISFARSPVGYLMQVTNKTGTSAQGTLLSQEGVEHGAFLIQNGGLYDLLARKDFVPVVQEMNKSLEGTGDLFRICFTDKTLHATRTQDLLPPLAFAVQKGLLDVLKIMLHYETQPVNYQGLLNIAIRCSASIKTIIYLLTRVEHPPYEKLVIIAASTGNMEAVKLFLPQIPNPKYNELLKYAAASTSGNMRLVEFLLTHVSHPDYADLLRCAAFSGSLKVINFFLDKGEDLIKKHPSSGILDTAISSYAVFFHPDQRRRRTDVEKKAGCCEVIEFLVKNGAVVTEKNLNTIASTGNIELTQLLLSHIPQPNYQQLLSTAIFSRSLALVKFFVEEKGTHVTQENLETAVRLGNKELVTMLLPHFPNPNYDQLLRIAVTQSNGSTIKIFIDKGASINAVDAQGKTLLREMLDLYLKTLIADGGKESSRALHCRSIIKDLVAEGAIITTEDIMCVNYHETMPLFTFLQNADIERACGLPLTSQEVTCINESLKEEV